MSYRIFNTFYNFYCCVYFHIICFLLYSLVKSSGLFNSDTNFLINPKTLEF